MGTYKAPEGTEVSTIVGGEEVRVKFGRGNLDVTDEALDAVLSGLADDDSKARGADGKLHPRIPITRVKSKGE